MDRDNKIKLFKLVAITLLILTGFLIIWEFWIGESISKFMFQKSSNKTTYEKLEFIFICLLMTSLALLPFIKITLDSLFDVKWAKKAIKKFKDKEQKLNLVDNSVTLIIDKDGTVSHINQIGCQLTGFKKEQIIGKKFIDTYIPSKSKEKIVNAFEILFSNASSSAKLQYTTSFLTKTQGERILNWQTSQLLDENGEVYGLLSSGQDVTEKSKLEQKLHNVQKHHENELKNITIELQDSRENYELEILRSSNTSEKLKLLLALGKAHSRISSSGKINASRTDDVIWQSLKYFGEYSGASHGYISLLVDNNTNMINTHLWGPSPNEPTPNPEDKIPLNDFPWFKRKILENEIIDCQDISQLPDEASREKSAFLAQNIMATINVPLVFNGSVMGYLCFESEQINPSWDEEDYSILKLLGEFFSNVIKHPELSEEIDYHLPVDGKNDDESHNKLVSHEVQVAKEPLLKQLEEKTNELIEFQEDFENLNNKNIQLQEELNEANLTLKQKALEIEKVNEDKSGNLEAELEKRKFLEQDFEEAKLSMQEQLSAVTEELESLKENIGKDTSDKAQIEEELESTTIALTETQNILSSLENEHSLLNQKVEQLELLEMELVEAGNTITQKENEFKELESEYQQLKEKANLLEKTQEQLDETRATLINQTSDLKKLTSEHDQLIVKHEKLKKADTKLIESQELIESKSQELDLLNNKYKKLESDFENLNSELQELRNDQQELNKARTAIESLKNDNELLNSAVQQLESEFTQKENSAIIAENNYNAALDKSGLAFVNLSDNLSILKFNKGSEINFGWDTNETIGKSFFEIILPKDIQEEIKSDALDALKTKPSFDFEGEIPFKDKPNKIYSWTIISESKDDNQAPSYLAMGQDISELKEISKSLQHQEGLLNTAIEDAIDGFITIDENGILQSFNAAAENIFGYTSSEIIGQNVNMLMPDPYQKEHDNYIRNYSVTGQAKMVGKAPREFLGKRKDGSVFPIEVAVREIQQGYQKLFVGIVRDITKRKDIEHTLKESEEKFRQLIAAESDAILIVNASNKKIIDANDSALELLGYDRDELIKLKTEDITTEDESHSSSGNGNSIKHITRNALQYYKKKDGTIFPAQVANTAFMAQNHKMNFRIIRDISKQIRLEENLKENQKHLQTIINNTPDAVYLKNNKGQYLLTNNKFESLFNLSNQQVKGKTDLELFPKDLANTFSENESQVLNTGKKVEQQTTIIHEDGVHTYHSINFPLKHSHSNVPYGMCGILKDITQNANLSKELNKYKTSLEQMVEKRTADLKFAQKKFIRSEKLSATNQLAKKVSSQINNSIFGIKNILEQINERASLEEMHKDLVGLGVKECNRIEDFITNLQNSHTPEQGKVGTVDLHTIIDGLVEETEKEMQEKNIVLEKRLATDIPKFKGVSEQIKQMISNIMQNAQESLSKENGRILIATDRDEGNIKITIQDTGCGIPPENMSAIFDPFFTTKSAINRSGMGLLLSLGIIKGHKGDIDVNSKPGAGTTFTITLPVDS